MKKLTQLEKNMVIRILLTLLVILLIAKHSHWSTTLGFFLVFISVELMGKILASIIKDFVEIARRIDLGAEKRNEFEERIQNLEGFARRSSSRDTELNKKFVKLENRLWRK